MVRILQYTYYTHDSQYLNVCQICLGFWTQQNIKGLGLKVLKVRAQLSFEQLVT